MIYSLLSYTIIESFEKTKTAGRSALKIGFVVIKFIYLIAN